MVDESILLDVLLNLLLLVAFDSHFVAFLSKFIILHLLNELVLIVHTLTHLLFLNEASCSVHSEHSFLLTLALVLSFSDLALAIRTTNGSQVVMVHAFLEFISLLHPISLSGVTVSQLLNGRANLHASFSLGHIISHLFHLHSFLVSSLEDVLGLHLLSNIILVVSVSSDPVAFDHVCIELFLIHILLVT